MAQEGRDEKGKFTAGNLFHMWVKKFAGGRYPKYETALDLAEAISKYLDFEDEQKRPDTYSGQGKGIYTLSGCALHLGFVSRDALQEYEKRDPLFSDVVKAFRLFMTDWNEKKIYWGGTFNGAKLWLTNFGGYLEEVTQHLKQTITEVKPEVMGGTPPIAEQ